MKEWAQARLWLLSITSRGEAVHESDNRRTGHREARFSALRGRSRRQSCSAPEDAADLEGVPYVEKAAEGGNRAEAYLLAGATLLKHNQFEAPRRDLDAALSLDSKLPNIYTLAGTARDKTGDPKQAEPAFREALKVNPDDFDANLYLGAFLYKRREIDEAKVYLDRALRINPSNSMVRYESAMLKSTTGEYQAAAEELEKLIKDDPDWLEPHVELATLYYRLHRPADRAKERQAVECITAEQQAKGPGK